MQGIRTFKRGGPRQKGRRFLLMGTLLLTSAIFLVGAPFVLFAISRIGREDWLILGNVGQAYGGVAAIFGIIALFGVIDSLRVQHRDSTANLELIQRTVHADLLARSIEDPELLACWGPPMHGNVAYNRQDFYCNQIVSFWRSMFEIGMITETGLEALAEHMFSNTPGRRYWSSIGRHFRKVDYRSVNDTAFFEIMERAYKRTSSRSTLEEKRTSPIDQAERSRTKRSTPYAALLVGLAAGAAVSGAASAIARRCVQ